MAMSTISLPTDHRRLPTAIGQELRRRRLQAGLSQASVGAPYTRALVCSVEHGRALPSLTTLAIFLEHLGVDFDEFFRGVQSEMTMGYTPAHGKARPDPAPRGRG
jgi:transcriptional regulator with XRE-family HTH domain